MSQVLETPTVPVVERRISPAVWRVAGALALAHVVVLLVAANMEKSPRVSQGVAGIRDDLLHGSLTRIMSGGYLEAFSFLFLLPVLVFLATAIGRRTEAGRWATQTALAAGVAFVAVTLGGAIAPGAAAVYDVQRGGDLHTALMVDDIRNFGFYISLLLLGAHALSLGIAALTDRVNTLWIGIGGVITGLALFVSIAGSLHNLQDVGVMIWMVWFVGVAVCLFRAAGKPGSKLTANRSVTGPAARP